MAFVLRHRANFEPLSITHCLSLKAPRLTTPVQWNWAWPLQTNNSINDLSKSVSQSPVRHVWISAIRAVAISDDASYIAFVSQHGAVALSRPHSDLPPTPISVPPNLQLASPSDSQYIEWCQTATSITFFDIHHSPTALNPRTVLAVGYASGTIAFFDASTTDLLAITKPHSSPVRRLRYYPAYHTQPQAQPQTPTYPTPNPNSGLFAIFAWSGTVARFSSDEMANLLNSPTPTIHSNGGGWLIWNLTAQDAVLDAVVCATTPAPIFDFDPDPHTAQLRLAVSGLNPPLACYAVTSDQAFSARAAAKRAATSVLSAARGFLFSRIVPSADPSAALAEESRAAVTGIARHMVSWADDLNSSFAFAKLPDVRGSARKALNAGFQAGLQRGLLNRESDAQHGTKGSRSAYGKLATSGVDDRSHGALLGGSLSENETSRLAFTSSASIVQNDVRRQRSLLGNEDIAASVLGSAKNTRVVERIAVAPPPCSLLATCDTLGRVLLQDPRDFCVLRVLKGYRDSAVAWLVCRRPYLVIHAPRLDVVELHGPLEQKRREAFRVLPGSLLIQSTCHHVFCMFPDGRLFELTETDQGGDTRSGNVDHLDASPDYVASKFHPGHVGVDDAHAAAETAFGVDEELASDYELTGAFVEAVKSGRTSRAVEYLHQVEDDAFKVSHLMATLVACTSHVRTEIHVALSSKASQIATKLRNPDLVCRFDAHRRLAEAFGLIAADISSLDPSVDRLRIAKYGPRLLEDDLGSGLAEFGVDELREDSKSSRIAGKRMRIGSSEMESVNCERFILSHGLVPTVDLLTDVEYEIHPRSDLSDNEQIWLAKAYFMKLLELDSVDVPTAGREHPTTADIFLALDRYIGLSEEEITRQFLIFFLHMPLIPLLNTHVSIYASPLRCAVARIRSQFSRDVIDPIILDSCETANRIANAVLLMRLCAIHEDDASSESVNPYVQSLDRLDEVLVYRKLIAGSRVSHEKCERFTARQCTGVPGDAEKHAVTYLIESDEYERAKKVLSGSHTFRSLRDLAWHEAASVSEAALYECRKKAADLIGELSDRIIPENVLSWIREADNRGVKEDARPLSNEERLTRFSDIRGVLLAAHAFISDSSVDAVRVLQLAEAMSALIELEKPRNLAVPTASQQGSMENAEENGREQGVGGQSGKEVIDLTLTHSGSENENEGDSVHQSKTEEIVDIDNNTEDMDVEPPETMILCQDVVDRSNHVVEEDVAETTRAEEQSTGQTRQDS